MEPTAGDDEERPLMPKTEESSSAAPSSFFERYVQPCAVECFGATVFVFVGTMAACLNADDLLAVAVTHGLAIAILITALGHISGGHFNPAISLGVFVSGRLPALLALAYFISQLLGAILGAALCMGVLSYPQVSTNSTALTMVDQPDNRTTYVALGGGAHTLAPGVSDGQAILSETLTTMLLVLTVLMTAVNAASKLPFAGFAIGLSLAVDIVATGKVTGGSMNPVRSFGPAVVMSSYDASVWGHHYVYWVGPTLGALIAAAFYRLLFADNDGRLVFKSGKQD